MLLIYNKTYVDEANYVMTNGKSYLILDTFESLYLRMYNVHDDTGDLRWIKDDCFINLQEHREKQLTKLLDNDSCMY